MVAPVLVDHRQLHAHARAGLDVPRAVRVARDVLRIVDALVAALDDEAVVRRLELEVAGAYFMPMR